MILCDTTFLQLKSTKAKKTKEERKAPTTELSFPPSFKLNSNYGGLHAESYRTNLKDFSPSAVTTRTMYVPAGIFDSAKTYPWPPRAT